MAQKTIKAHIRSILGNLKKDKFAAFVEELLDRREEPCVQRNAVEDQGYLTVTNVLVSTFTESKAPEVVADLLRQIGCYDEADKLVKDTAALCSSPGSTNTAGPSSGAAAGDTMAEDKHFVDTHRVALIENVVNVNEILDQLLTKEVISDEKYAEIGKLLTPHAKIRELCLSLKPRKSKDIFYELLKKHEKNLIEELNK